MLGYGLDRAGSGQGQVAGTCEFGNEPSGSIKCGEFLDQLQAGQLLKKDSAAWNNRLPGTKIYYASTEMSGTIMSQLDREGWSRLFASSSHIDAPSFEDVSASDSDSPRRAVTLFALNHKANPLQERSVYGPIYEPKNDANTKQNRRPPDQDVLFVPSKYGESMSDYSDNCSFSATSSSPSTVTTPHGVIITHDSVQTKCRIGMNAFNIIHKENPTRCKSVSKFYFIFI